MKINSPVVKDRKMVRLFSEVEEELVSVFLLDELCGKRGHFHPTHSLLHLKGPQLTDHLLEVVVAL